ncbi:MAG TPA: diacylglycerol kinase family protein [Halanaerobiales bacterium]|nr:diacylglycerol kinase family protein [Halanaerobiales bacterium]
MREKIFVIVNPVSANGRTARRWPEHEKYLKKKGLKMDVYYTKYPFHAAELARKAVKENYMYLMVVGGDGTLNEVVNGLIEDGVFISSEIKLIIFSQGTGCDFIRALGLKNDVAGVYRVIKEGRIRKIDIGRVTYQSKQGKEKERYFINIADFGIGAETVELVNRSSKIMGGFLSYLLGVLRTIVRYRNREVQLRIDAQNILYREINSVMVGNGEYFGGGVWIAPGADPGDGLFKIIVLEDFTKLEIITNLIKAYKGTHLSHPKVKAFEGRDIRLDSSERIIIEADGEIFGYLPARFSLLDTKVPILVNTE